MHETNNNVGQFRWALQPSIWTPAEQEITNSILSAITKITSYLPDDEEIPKLYSLATDEKWEAFFLTLGNVFPDLAGFRNCIPDVPFREVRRRLLKILRFKLDDLEQRKLLVSSFKRTFTDLITIYEFSVMDSIREGLLGQTPSYNGLELVKKCMNQGDDSETLASYSQAFEQVEAEIARFQCDEEIEPKFKQLLAEFETETIGHIESYVDEMLFDFHELMWLEYESKLMAKMKTVFGYDLSRGRPVTAISKSISVLKKRVNQRLKIGPGGARPRKGFVWKDEEKIRFFEVVEGLPKIRGKSIWDVAFSELREKEFDMRIVAYFRQDKAFKEVPRQLLDEAIKSWRKYRDPDMSVAPQDRPRSFEYRHALSILKYPNIKYSTAQKYFLEGRKLAKTEVNICGSFKS
jgi:hypothetical protein